MKLLTLDDYIEAGEKFFPKYYYVMGEMGDVGYFKPRLGTDEWIYDWVYVKETTDEDLQRVLDK